MASVCGVVVLPGCGAGFTISLWACCAARCFSLCGMLKKYCQPISTRPDRMTARMVLRLSVIVQGLVIQFGLRLAPESLCLDAVSLRAPAFNSLENALDGLVTRFLGCRSRRSSAERRSSSMVAKSRF